jgi:hypothetical protein
MPRRPIPELKSIDHAFVVKTDGQLYDKQHILEKAKRIEKELRVYLHDPGIIVEVSWGDS